MNDSIDTTAPTSPPVAVTFTPAARPMSKRQIKAALLEGERLASKKWKTLLPVAKTAWAKVPSEELARVNGNVHVLAGLIQMRYQTSRSDADLQVRQFLLQHMPAEGSVSATS